MESDWRYLPDIVLEDIFELLSWRDRLTCSCVCDNWNNIFYIPRLWRRLVVTQSTFTYLRQNLMEKTYHRKLRSYKVQSCLTRIGHNFREIIVKENKSFPNLYQFLSVLNSFLEYFDEYPMPLLERFYLTFPCESIGLWSNELVIIGTGGQILEGLKRLLGNLKGIKALVYNNLLIQAKDTPGFMENFLESNRYSLQYLEVLNLTKYRHPLFCAGMFPNLNTLVISPTQLTDNVAVMVAERTKCSQIVIVQDRFNSEVAESVSSHAWWEVKHASPKLRVRLEVNGRTDAEIMIQPAAPVEAVVYNSYQSKVTPHVVLQLAEEYKYSLRAYGHKSIHRKHSSNSFYERSDTTLVLLIRECPFINTLIITERISTCTLLIIATETKNLKNFYVRKNAVILKCDWPRSADWSGEFYTWLKNTSKDYGKVEEEIRKLIRQKKWHLLSDKEFIKL